MAAGYFHNFSRHGNERSTEEALICHKVFYIFGFARDIRVGEIAIVHSGQMNTQGRQDFALGMWSSASKLLPEGERLW